MSIAVSAVVRPSVCLRILQAGFAVGAIGAGALLAGGWAGRFAAPWTGAAISIAGGLVLLLLLRQNSIPQRLDISGVGQIRLAVYQYMAGAVLVAGAEDEEVVCAALLAASTLWPGLLLLRLRRADGRVTVLPVWRVECAGDVFRPLAVACRAIAGRGGALE